MTVSLGRGLRKVPQCVAKLPNDITHTSASARLNINYRDGMVVAVNQATPAHTIAFRKAVGFPKVEAKVRKVKV